MADTTALCVVAMASAQELFHVNEQGALTIRWNDVVLLDQALPGGQLVAGAPAGSVILAQPWGEVRVAYETTDTAGQLRMVITARNDSQEPASASLIYRTLFTSYRGPEWLDRRPIGAVHPSSSHLGLAEGKNPMFSLESYQAV